MQIKIDYVNNDGEKIAHNVVTLNPLPGYPQILTVHPFEDVTIQYPCVQLNFLLPVGMIATETEGMDEW